MPDLPLPFPAHGGAGRVDGDGSDPGAPQADVLEILLAGGERAEQLRHVREIPGRSGIRADWPTWVDPRLVAAYRGSGVEAPWRHQVETAEAVHAGRHTVIATSTGSGKSLAVWLPTLSGILTSPAPTGSVASLRRRPTALYLSPTKALAADQLASLERLLDAGDLSSQVRVASCDGDTSFDERGWVRAHADVVLTNPDFLHFSLLPGHERWTRLLRGLTHVIVDECHAYRGVFGAHVSLVLRRLLRLARFYGADPIVVAASATTGEPADTLVRLTGVDPDRVHATTRDTAPQGRRRIVFWEPAALRSAGWEDWGDEGWGEGATLSGAPEVPRRSALTESAELLRDLVRARRRTLAFVRSRAGSEVVAATAAEAMGEDAYEGDPVEVLRRGGRVAVAAYRGGYLPEERRTLEDALRTGRLTALATTNALELGVDISGLDAVLMTGWPGTRVSFWQQAGRAGRAGADGVAVLVASANPLDTYLVNHPSSVLDEAIEVTTFDPTNPYVLAPHLCAAAAEVPLTQDDLAVFGLATTDLLDELVRRGLLRRRPTGWFWNQARREVPSQLTDLRGSGVAGVAVVDGVTGAMLGTVDGGRADSTVHPGAVYVHQGRTFVVEQLEDDVALVLPGDVAHRTMATAAHHASFVDVLEEMSWGPVTWRYGHVEVTSQVQGYDVRVPPSMEVVARHELDLPVRVLPTTGVWWTLGTDTLLAETGIAPGDVPGALHAAEHAAIGVLPLLATCDRWDIGGLSTALHPETGAPTVLVHDGHPGGAGFAQRGFRAARRWIEATYEAVASCGCRHGCPRCVYSPKCGNGNSPLDKGGALAVLDYLRSLAP
ncbi:DEAD/DEAH box helicase [Serinibacter arcticus]|uniref:DEAD/DEAH box helicase n=1 Tax=Serinibacter arcticus TaxID=1655435 RepID=UPI002E26268F